MKHTLYGQCLETGLIRPTDVLTRFFSESGRPLIALGFSRQLPAGGTGRCPDEFYKTDVLRNFISTKNRQSIQNNHAMDTTIRPRDVICPFCPNRYLK